MANRFSKFLSTAANHAVASAAILIVLMLIMPVSGPFLDILMMSNVAISMIILLVVIYTPKASALSSFPRVVLFTTIFGLALNVCSTRYILGHGGVGFDNFKGNMIKAFSQIVAGSDVIIGLVIFVILIIIQTVVITKGATRVSEVAARFALDSMPNKMMSVEQSLNAGYITDEQARIQRAQIQKESDFYSAMDGSSKFVSGNVKAGIFITVINLVVGILYAMIKQHMSWSNAIDTFPRLTIGDGLLSQLPSLLLSTATGILVTGSNSDEVLGEEIKKQFNVSGYVYIISGIVLVLMSMIFHQSAYLVVALLAIGGLMIYFGWRLLNAEKIKTVKAQEAKNNVKNTTGQNPAEVSPINPPDPLSLELGIGLVGLVDKEKGAELLERVTRIRKEAALDLGLVVPPIRIMDNMALDGQEYSFKINGIEKGRSKLKLGYYMCLNTGSVTEEMKGEVTKDPAFGVPAIWVPEESRNEAERNGYSVIDPPTIIATHLTEIIRANAADILSRQTVSNIINKIKETQQVVVDEVISTYKYTYGEIEKILQGLLREQVSIRNIVAILETLANYGMYTPHNVPFLIEKVREELGAQICLQYVDPGDKKLSVLRLSDGWTDKILQYKVESANGGQAYVGFPPVEGRKWISNVSASLAGLREKNYLPIILCKTDVRALVRESLERDLPGTIVLSYNEVLAAGNNINVEILGEISE